MYRSSKGPDPGDKTVLKIQNVAPPLWGVSVLKSWGVGVPGGRGVDIVPLGIQGVTSGGYGVTYGQFELGAGQGGLFAIYL